MQLVHDLLINLHSNNYHLISRCCHGNKTKNPRWPPSIFEILLNISHFYSKNRKFDINWYDDVINADVTQLVSKDVFIIEEQLCKSV